jgi:metal-responsive CopG/Arc/MetJ family transcriptional regulator
MSTEMVRINISLPISISEELEKMTKPRKRSQFIAQAIQLRIKQLKEAEKAALLEEGYKASSMEGINISRDFEAIDIENWDEY